MLDETRDKNVGRAREGTPQNGEDALSADRPLSDPKDDRLGYAPFAKHLGKALSKMMPVEGFVVSINGPWGSGKTTVLNFIEHYLNDVEERKRPEIIHFNPWWFSGCEELTRRFFVEVSRAIDPRDGTLREIRRALWHLGRMAEKMPKPGGFWVSLAGKVCARLGRWLGRREPDLAALRDKASKLLRSKGQRFVVFIDDVDRLTTKEVCELFRTIKAIAGLPNMMYVVAFDKTVVTEALGSVQELRGEEYLGKIVQVPFELPLPDRASMRALLFERLDMALGPLEDSEFDQQRWANVYLDGIDAFIRTPRDVTRLCNAITVSFAAVSAEVNAVDFIAIEAIRLFAPEVYRAIRANSEEFVGGLERTCGQEHDLKLKFHEGYLKDLDERVSEPMKLLLQRLFPKVEGVWGRVGYGADSEREWRRQLRVCSADVFPAYFGLQLPEGAIGAREIRTFLEKASEKSKVVEHLRSLVGQKHHSGITLARALLERLEDYTQETMPEESVESILLGLFDVGDELWAAEPDRRGFYDFGVEMQIMRIVYQLLNGISDGKRFDVLMQAVKKGQSLAIVIEEIATVDRMVQKSEESQGASEEAPLVAREKVEELKRLASERIAAEADKGSLASCVKLDYVLHCWKSWDDSGACDKWVNSLKANTRFVVSLLTSSLQSTFSQAIGFPGLGDRVAKREYRINLKSIREFLELQQVQPIVQTALEEGNLSDRERIALETFLQEVQRPKDGEE